MKAYAYVQGSKEEVFEDPRAALKAYLDDLKSRDEEPDSTVSVAVLRDEDGKHWFCCGGYDWYLNWCELDEVKYDYFDKDRIAGDFDFEGWTQENANIYYEN